MKTYFSAEPAQQALRQLAEDRKLSMRELAKELGLDRRTVQRVFARTLMRFDAADHIAIALGRHPYELWPDWFGPITEVTP